MPTSIQSQLPVISQPVPIIAATEVPTQSEVVTQVQQTLSSRYAISAKSSSSVRYSPVYKNPENHIEELNFRLKTLNDQRRYGTLGIPEEGAVGGQVPDINPSVGSDNEKESELNIRQLESSVSSLSGLPSGSSTVNSPEAVRNRQNLSKDWHIERYETDF